MKCPHYNRLCKLRLNAEQTFKFCADKYEYCFQYKLIKSRMDEIAKIEERRRNGH